MKSSRNTKNSEKKEKTNITTTSKSVEKIKKNKSQDTKGNLKNQKNPINQENNKKEVKFKNPEKEVKQVNIRLNIDYIFRREHYSIKNQKISFTLGDMKKLISKELKLNENDFQILYFEKEINNPKEKIYDMIKEKKIKFFEVKKIVKPFEDSLESYSYIVSIENFSNGYDLNQQIEVFFQNMLIEKKCICEPKTLNSYNVSFTHKDLAFDFKKYLTILKRTNPIYANITTKIIIPEEPKVATFFEKKKVKDKNKFRTKNLSMDYKNKLGTYVTYNDLKNYDRTEGRNYGFMNKIDTYK